MTRSLQEGGIHVCAAEAIFRSDRRLGQCRPDFRVDDFPSLTEVLSADRELFCRSLRRQKPSRARLNVIRCNEKHRSRRFNLRIDLTLSNSHDARELFYVPMLRHHPEPLDSAGLVPRIRRQLHVLPRGLERLIFSAARPAFSSDAIKSISPARSDSMRRRSAKRSYSSCEVRSASSRVILPASGNTARSLKRRKSSRRVFQS